jgi:hypothetical protein
MLSQQHRLHGMECKKMMNDEQGRMWNEVIVAYFKVIKRSAEISLSGVGIYRLIYIYICMWARERESVEAQCYDTELWYCQKHLTPSHTFL